MLDADPQHGIRPDLRELIALRGLLSGRRAPRRGQHGHAGHGLSLQRGRGMEYAESRDYTAGDDARHIDWRVTARSGRLHTKLFQAERERLTLIVADTAAALYFGTRARYKSVQAARLGAVAAWMAQRDGDRVAALRGTRKEALQPPASGDRGALRALDRLCRWYAAAPSEDAGLPFALDHAQRLLRPGSRCIVLADPASVLDVPPQRWAGLRRHADMHVLLLVDAFELAPPITALHVRGTAGGAVLQLDLSAQAQRQAWSSAFAEVLAAAHAHLHARGIRATTIHGNDAPDAWIDAPAQQVA